MQRPRGKKKPTGQRVSHEDIGRVFSVRDLVERCAHWEKLLAKHVLTAPVSASAKCPAGLVISLLSSFYAQPFAHNCNSQWLLNVSDLTPGTLLHKVLRTQKKAIARKKRSF